MIEKNDVVISFRISSSLYQRINLIARHFDWSFGHVLRKVIPLGLDAFWKSRCDFLDPKETE